MPKPANSKLYKPKLSHLLVLLAIVNLLLGVSLSNPNQSKSLEVNVVDYGNRGKNKNNTPTRQKSTTLKLEQLVPGFDFKAFFNENSVEKSADGFGNYVSKPTINGNLYLGFGNIPSLTNGAAILKYRKGKIEYVGELKEQGIQQIYTNQNTVYIPGEDPTQSWDYGNFYKIEDNTFTMYREILKDQNGNPILDDNGNTIPVGLERVLHGFNVALADNGVIYHIGSTDKYLSCENPGFNNECSVKLFKSTDNATTWSFVAPYLGYNLAYFNNHLYTARVEGNKTNTPTINIYKTNEAEIVQTITIPINKPSFVNRQLYTYNNKLYILSSRQDNNGSALITVDENDNTTITNLPFNTYRSSNYYVRGDLVTTSNDGYLYLHTNKNEIVRTNDPELKRWEVILKSDKEFVSMEYYGAENALILGEAGGSGDIWKVKLTKNPEDINVLEYLENATIKGKVDYEYLQNSNNETLSVKLYKPGTKIDLYHFQNVKLSSTGEFEIQDILPGTYEISIKGINTLQNVRKHTLSPGDVKNINFGKLLAGDINNDNLVSVKDVTPIFDSFNTQLGDDNFNNLADLNRDNKVTLLDFSILTSNLDKRGEYISAVTPPPRKADIIGILRAQSNINYGGDAVLTLYNKDTKETKYYTAQILVTGTFIATDIEPGDYEIGIKKLGYLQKVVEEKLQPGTTQIVFENLLAGDTNLDNKVSVEDRFILTAAFNSQADSDEKYDKGADFNNDGRVTGLDLSLMATNYGKVGEVITSENAPEQINTEFTTKLVGRVNFSYTQTIDSVPNIVSVKVFDNSNGELITTYQTYVSNNGVFAITDVASGNYQVGVKGLNTLQKVKQDITMSVGETPVEVVDFGNLLIGDANNDNKVTQEGDLIFLQNAYNTGINSKNYDPRADFNNDWWVDILDYSLFATNINTVGEKPITSRE